MPSKFYVFFPSFTVGTRVTYRDACGLELFNPRSIVTKIRDRNSITIIFLTKKIGIPMLQIATKIIFLDRWNNFISVLSSRNLFLRIDIFEQLII